MESYDYPVSVAERALADARAAATANPQDRSAEMRVERAEGALANAKRQRAFQLKVDADRAAEEATKAAARDAEAVAHLTEELRGRYMTAPGATEDRFQAALPDLLEARRRDEALHGHEREVAKALATGKYVV